jgi:uncharacterized repeat protein (TIGR03803 family)
MKNMLRNPRWTSAGRFGVLTGVLALLFLSHSTPIESAQPGTTYTVLYKFTDMPDGAFPVANATLDSEGNLYGTTYGGGANGFGTVFEVDASGKESVLYSFNATNSGVTPAAGVIRDADGNIYGTTPTGGLGKFGVAFKLNPTGVETAIHIFNGARGDGAAPYGELIQDSAGKLYGTTSSGGEPGYGQVFKLTYIKQADVWEVKDLYNFKGETDGGVPYAGLVMDKTGNLYGTTTAGGNASCDCGVVFKVDSTGAETVLYTFTGPATGGYPYAGVTLGSDGDVYGATTAGGNPKCNSGDGCGVVYKVDTSGIETVLHEFTGNADGGVPYSGVILDAAGNLYGMTSAGGNLTCNAPLGCGVVFKVDPSGQESVLYTFTAPNGSTPEAGLTKDSAGNLYGTTSSGGDTSCGFGFGCGVVFKLSPQ